LKEEVDIRTFINSLKVIKLGISWGGHESLIFPSSIQLQAAKPNPAIDFGLSPRLIRLNVGLEGTEVLYEDLRFAINLAIENSKLSNGV
jgi:cystathionine beta-lyase/cystathionine gamma-synthase